jgi:hypothetical protein
MENKIKVKHKKGRFISDWKSVLLVSLKMLFSKRVVVYITMKSSITELIYTRDVLKACGWKSGINTETNTECIAGYAFLGIDMQGCVYTRPNKVEKLSEWFSFDIEPVEEISDNPFQYRFRYELVRPKGCWIPVFPWAGGDELPLDDFEYELEII